VKVMSALTEL